MKLSSSQRRDGPPSITRHPLFQVADWVHRRFTDLCIQNVWVLFCFVLVIFCILCFQCLRELCNEWRLDLTETSQGLRRERFLFCGTGILSMTLQILVATSCPEGTGSISGSLYLNWKGIVSWYIIWTFRCQQLSIKGKPMFTGGMEHRIHHRDIQVLTRYKEL